nr:hypothetical protein [Paenibacillus tengchongensis]
MAEYPKCVRCGFRYVTDKARENFVMEGMQGEALLCLHCLGELTRKVMNKYGYLVHPDAADALDKHHKSIPRSTLDGCRPCMQKRGGR